MEGNAFHFLFVITDVTWNADDESPTAIVTGQSREHCPYQKSHIL